eukprot:CAMPEP_0198238886 /NCGR_PEP_ID=MMETSP1446-20131203/4423_1 /TAXON_ID=1461542 ORGANISM="Unidentified sp, Strain CCMP2111" /NCGR_SAMPLE_ID=MMETSP1446 /ASSEMBLY_ACC=CAM_ASM_001112 /LENGTH=381 /DNA_ID=CAMNT_0043921377 /DNA_START=1 /DNA_END=1142 /DNA_ORIENTATION=-
MYLYLSWTDPRAKQAVLDATDAYRNGSVETCRRPCSSAVELDRDQVQFLPQYSCCDSIWLPSIGIMNAYELPGGRLQHYDFFVDIEGDSGAVGWSTTIQAAYFTPMYFRNFPFDSQNLIMQFQNKADGVTQFIPSATSTRWLIEGRGDIVSGWNVTNIGIYPKQASTQDRMKQVISEFGISANPDDPMALTGKAFDDDRPASRGVFIGFDINIRVTRFGRYYVLNMLAPLFLLVSLSFLTYLIPPHLLEARVTLDVTLFLSLTALQFVVNDQLPRSSYPTTVTELILMCYAVITFAMPETILVYFISESKPIDSSQENAIRISTDSPNIPLSRRLTWKTLSRLWRSVRRSKHSSKVAFAIDMVSLVLAVLTVILCSLAIVL